MATPRVENEFAYSSRSAKPTAPPARKRPKTRTLGSLKPLAETLHRQLGWYQEAYRAWVKWEQYQRIVSLLHLALSANNEDMFVQTLAVVQKTQTEIESLFAGDITVWHTPLPPQCVTAHNEAELYGQRIVQLRGHIGADGGRPPATEGERTGLAKEALHLCQQNREGATKILDDLLAEVARQVAQLNDFLNPGSITKRSGGASGRSI